MISETVVKVPLSLSHLFSGEILRPWTNFFDENFDHVDVLCRCRCSNRCCCRRRPRRIRRHCLRCFHRRRCHRRRHCHRCQKLRWLSGISKSAVGGVAQVNIFDVGKRGGGGG